MKMKAIQKAQAGPGARLIEAEVPSPGFGEVLVKVRVASICGTDAHIYTWDAWSQQRIKPPLIFGHEFAGDIVELGAGVQRAKIDDYVSAETHVVCNSCTPCRTGNQHVCLDCKILGVDIPGAFAEYVVIPEQNLWWNPPTMDPAIAALQEPLGNAVHTVFTTPVSGKTVLVTGCGPIGVLSVGVAKAAGAKTVIATDLNPYRLDLARKMGADIVVNSKTDSTKDIVMNATRGEGVEVVLEMSGAPQAIRDGLEVIQNAGRMSLLGIPSKTVEIDIANHIVFKGIQIQGITGRRMFDTWYTVQGLLESGRLDVRPVLTHQFRLDQFEEAMQTMLSGESGKVTLFP